MIALYKYAMGLPFYRQAILFAGLGTPIAMATQYELVAGAAEKLRPVHNELMAQDKHSCDRGQDPEFHQPAHCSERSSHGTPTATS
ncbi:MAG: hypothetical protein CMLOHMNK_03340 [Steroidobacteraceae bacterium]|nr:hypothetical protein [Steroidobacteraceae bacterium]